MLLLSLSGGIYPAPLDEFEKVDGVVSNVVCEIRSYLFGFHIHNAFDKCFFIHVCAPIVSCIVCLCTCIESLFLSVLSAKVPGKPGKSVPI